MEITDKQVIKILDKLRSPKLTEQLYEIVAEEERDGRSDMQVLVDELDWLLYKYQSGQCSQNESLTEARQILNETHYGKVIPNDYPYLNNSNLGNKSLIQESKDIVNEYNRLLRLQTRLQNQGYTSL